MSGNQHLKAWVSRETKQRFTEFARGQGVSESALLKRVIEGLIGGNEVRNATLPPLERVPTSGRLSVRLAVDDLLLLRERARSRGMPSALTFPYWYVPTSETLRLFPTTSSRFCSMLSAR
jgi:hypothetical protein